jgi:hypothetical protein
MQRLSSNNDTAHDNSCRNRTRPSSTTTVARSVLTMDAPLEISICVYGLVIIGYISIGLFVCIGHRPSRYALGVVGLLLCLIGLGYMITLVVLICAILVDLPYYAACHTELALLISWGIVGLLLCADYAITFCPKVAITIRRWKLRHQAGTMTDPVQAALLAADSNNVGVSSLSTSYAKRVLG